MGIRLLRGVCLEDLALILEHSTVPTIEARRLTQMGRLASSFLQQAVPRLRRSVAVEWGAEWGAMAMT